MKLLSKELISEVLGKEVEQERFIDSNSLTYVHNGMYFDINVYELAHKCKEWAFKNGIEISSCIDENGGWANIRTNEFIPTVFAKSEQEAIFKACELIIKQLNVSK